jgi:hypothetical protein
MSELRCVRIDGRNYAPPSWTSIRFHRRCMGKRPIVDWLPGLYRRLSDYESDSDEDDATAAGAAMLHYHEHCDQLERERDAALYRRNQTSRQFVMSQARMPRRPRKPTYSKRALEMDFQTANHTLKVRWQECNTSHADKVTMARTHNKRMQPHTKIELLENLGRKMRSFRKKLENLPPVRSVDTESKKQAYIQGAESITKISMHS